VRAAVAENIATALKLLAGEATPHIPTGRVVRGDVDINVGFSWHIDPTLAEFADTATDVCDGRPSDLESSTISSDTYRP
jgi:hypothetical protein